jgi:1,4-alpha-glucan branching enzyme
MEQLIDCQRANAARQLVEKLNYTDQFNPHAILGLHLLDDAHKVIRLWRPGAKELYIQVKGKIVEAVNVDQAGLFEYVVPKDYSYTDYKIFHHDGKLAHDPYAFWPSFGEFDQYLFGRGVHYTLYRQMGARLFHHAGLDGVKFTLWAPSAKGVSLVSDFNHWDGRVNPMRSLGSSGVWELFVPGITVGEKYKFEIRTQSEDILIKSDPYALCSEMRPKTASVVADVDSFEWSDKAWLEKRKAQSLNRPINIYELHLGSWKRSERGFLNYKEIAHELAIYCKEMCYTHVELLPIAEHPLDESWGYQVTGFFAVTSRFGSPQDFQYFVNHLHKEGIGVILDWVPGHFPVDEFSLANFDGTSLYEHSDPRQGFHPHWSTAIFNYGRLEVANFLIASALHWLDIYHIDGLRVDAVASMLYLDYGREDGNWIPNCYGGKENLEAVEFIKHANSIIHNRFPGVLIIAEESTAFGGITHSLDHNGLGFDLKWNMGWMNDTLRYISKDPIYRQHHHNDLTFGLLYAFTEKFVLGFSHDEVVHGKRSMLSKMPGDLWQKFANVRLVLSYQICQPGKKLQFMGVEIGQWNEWYCNAEMEWLLLEYPLHKGLQACLKELNRLYLKESALWSDDFSHEGFEWVDFRDEKNSVISYFRKSKNEKLLCIHNFTPQFHSDYQLHFTGFCHLEELFNSDQNCYGGSGKAKGSIEILHDVSGRPSGIKFALAPLATMIFRVYF